jgi:hypothetical protein
MHFLLLVQLLTLIAVANTTPLIAKALLGSRLSASLDRGLLFFDERPLFGPSKTVRGIVSALITTTAIAPLLGIAAGTGLLMAAAAMLGDVSASFLKRRLKLAPSSKSTGLDQIPESLLPLLAARFLFELTLLDIVTGTLAFLLGEIVLARLCFRLHLRDRPY